MSEGEIWKDIDGYEGLYKVSDRGNVYSVERISLQGRKIGGIILKPRYTRGDYIQVGLHKNGKVEKKYTHRLVAEVFIPNPNNYLEINHKDENKTNNHVKNLEWCTREYNNTYGTRIERVVKAQSKIVRAVNVKTGEVITFNSMREAGRKGYNIRGVSQACRGIYYGGNLYRGHKWYYEEEGG